MSASVEEREDGQWVVLDGKGEVLATYAHANTAVQHARQLNVREAAEALGTHGLYKRVEQNDHRQGCVCNRGITLPGDENLVCPIHGKVHGVKDDAMEEMLWVDPEAPVSPVGEQKFTVVYSLLAGTYRGLDFAKRVPALMRSRGWPADNADLNSVIAAAAALVVIGATATVIRRPPAADALRGAWPQESGSLTAGQVVIALDLQSLTAEF